MTKSELLQSFNTTFGMGETPRVFFAGGRVNLIGEHVDYNGGHVLPCALTMGTWGLLRHRTDDRLRFYSLNFPQAGVLEGTLSNIRFHERNQWTNYVLGMLFALGERGIKLSSGFELLVYGNIPNGSGLSSSASLEMVAGAAFRACYGLDLTNVELAILGQRAENGFIGLNSGIMDQFSIALGKEDSAVFLNTGTLSYEYVPVALGDNVILIMNTCKRRTLADSKYNERRAECESALKALQKVLPVKDLASVDLRTFEKNKGLIENETERKRAEHVIYECARTVEACQKLRAGDLVSFGRLMDASHDSLRDLYAVSCKELDTLVSEARKCPGVLGARMTGAGFGGCAVAIVDKNAVDAVMEQVGAAYEKAIGHPCAFYVASIGGGPKEL
ncbi:MAG: galactokinase [Clostridia bacterium]|nr:galactokinase [Clostridia bacterium]